MRSPRGRSRGPLDSLVSAQSPSPSDQPPDRPAEMPASFEEYFRLRRDGIRRSAYLLCGDWHRADDLAQTAFVRLHRKWGAIREPRAVDAYLRRTLVRAMIDETRRPWRRERFVADTPEVSGADAAETVVTRQALVEALRRVPPRQRAVLVLRFLEGLDVSATAAALGCREGTVKSQCAAGLATLRTVLGEESGW